MQEYISITTLSNIRIAYTNGYMETMKVVDLEDIQSLLEEIIVPTEIENVTKEILKSYCKIMNYNDEFIDFIEKIDVNYGECFGLNEVETFWRRRKVTDTYKAEGGGLEIKVQGVILEVQKNILRTPSLVVDALLGQGEALDCFNTKAQDAVVIGENLKNLELLQKLELVEGVADPIQKMEMYKKVFGTCCDTPQTQILP